MISNVVSNGRVQKIYQRLHLGKALYQLYHKPKGLLEKTLKRGLVNSAIDNNEKKKMEAAASQLPTMALPPPYYDIHFLTGDRFWYQTIFCAYSMVQHSEISLRPVIYDDGSLSEIYQKEILRVFPNAEIHLKAELDARIESYLPVYKFPYLRERRENYPNLRKLTDIHVGSEGWKLVLDSDMLFFKRPDTLLNWLKKPQSPCHMVDVETSYGYSIPFMADLAAAPIAERLNVGICGLNSSDINWEKLEYWCKTLIEKEGTHYFQEQALVAMLMAGQSCVVADKTDYDVMPGEDEVLDPRAVLHHYVSTSKPWYFRHAWKHITKED